MRLIIELPRPHILSMKMHPHAEATYRVVSISGGGYAVEVSIPFSQPARVSKFATQEAADAWITSTQQRVDTETAAGRWFEKPSQRKSRQ